MKTEKHIHKFKRLRYKSGNEIFFCALPDCNQKLSTALALGKRSMCWRCGEAFIMNEYSLRLSKPHCDGCHRPKKDLTLQEQIAEDTVLDGIAKIEHPSLLDRLNQTIQQAKQTTEEEEI
jgi:hypothetical protein